MDDKLPKHIAFIMDGNGRWAILRGLSRINGHKQGIIALKKTLHYVYELGIKYISLYAFSKENWKRPKSEVDGIMKLLEDYIDEDLSEMIEKNIRLNIMGDIFALKEDLRKKIINALEQTKTFDKFVLNIGINYSGRDEILRAANNAIKDGYKEIDDAVFEKYLYTQGMADPDLIIRTSGEQRISNFMLYQSAYSELYFTKTLWPDFSKKTLLKAIESYKKRNRKFGDIKNTNE